MALVEWEFSDTADGDGQFMATGKVIEQLRRHLAKNEVDAAVQLYESCVQSTVGKELWQEFTGGSTQMKKNIANLFYRSRDYVLAAKACEQLEEWGAAAKAYASCDEWAKAAACYSKAGKKEKAAKMFEKVGDHRRAAEIYYGAKDYLNAGEALAKAGDPMGAGQLFMRGGDDQRAAATLSQVPSNHPQFVQAVGLLSELFVKLGRRDLAAQRLAMALPAGQPVVNKMHGEIAYRLGRLMWEQGNVAKARQAFELVVAWDAGYKDARKLLDQLGANKTAPIAPATTGAFRAVVAGQKTVDVEAPQAPTKKIPPAGSTDPFAALDGNPFAPRPQQQTKDVPAPATTIPVGFVQRMEGYEVLKQLSIFEDLTLEEMKVLYSISEQVEYPAGQILIEQGHPGSGLIVVRSGSLRVCKVEGGGRETVLATLPAGKHVGEMSLLDDSPTSARVTAAEPVKALRISKDRLEKLLFENDRIALRVYRTFVRALSDRLRSLNARA